MNNIKKKTSLLRYKDNEKGFTLIELMIVMTIIAILLTIAQPMYRESTIKSSEAGLMEDLFALIDVIDQFYLDKSRYPDSLEELTDGGYIRSLPKDPFTRTTDTWQFVAPPDGFEGSIYDVHSGSDLVALDGTAYNEW